MTDDDHPSQSLRRIIQLLMALADFAERASGRSSAFCIFMIWLLRPAEAAASAYADIRPDLQTFAPSGDARRDAMRLALRFRLLADAILHEAELALHFAYARKRRARRTRPIWSPSPVVLNGLVRHAEHIIRAPDTS